LVVEYIQVVQHKQVVEYILAEEYIQVAHIHMVVLVEHIEELIDNKLQE